jgi:hypothetical protein
MSKVERLTRRLREGPVVAAIVLTAMTVVLVGGVLLTTTSIGCGPANKLGLKGITSRCTTGLTAARQSPSPSPNSSPTPTESLSPSPVLPTQPVFPSASAPNPPVGDTGSPAYPILINSSGGGAPSPAALNCRLPVYVGPAGSGGFIVLPSNTFIADPTSNVSLPTPGNPTPSPPGYGAPQTALSYDHAYSRWLPAPLQAVSADGTRYAYATAQGLYVVTVSSGAVDELGAGRAWTILAVGTTGVYATVPNAGGLWLLPFSGSAPQQITANGFWQGVGGGAAYGTPTSAVPQGTPSTIERLDLSTGTIADYFTRPGQQSQVVGFDGQGEPVIYSSGPLGSEVWIGNSLFLMATRTLSGYYYGQTTVGFQPSGPPVADAHGLWFSGFLYNANSDIPGYAPGSPAFVLYIPGSNVYVMTAIGAQLAGGCN